MSGLFSTFNIAKRGMEVQQKSLDVTSHNIANANTEGYTRQRARIETTRPYGMPSLSSTVEAGQVGTGAQVSAIERIKNNFLDYQVRNETSIFGYYENKSNILAQVEGIFNEPSDTGISSLLGKFYDSWQQLSKQPQSSNARTVVAQQTLALTDALNHTYGQLKSLKQDTQSLIKNNVTDINSMLNQINQLNKEIMSVENAGNSPNDLMDKRDLLLDQLSKKFGITVENKAFGGIDLKPNDTNGMKAPQLVKSDLNSQVARFSYITGIEKDESDLSGTTYKITYYKLGNMDSTDNKQTIILKDVTPEQLKQIQSSRVLWSSEAGIATKADGYEIKNGETIYASELKVFTPTSGELGANISIQNDLDGYMDQLNKLAKSIAFTVNAVHSGMSSINSNGTPDKDYMPFFVNGNAALYGVNGELSNLDYTLQSESEITAENITINKEILNDVMKIKTRTNDDKYPYASLNTTDGEGDGARALAIASLRNSSIMIQDFGSVINSRKDLFDLAKGGSVLSNNGMTIANNINGTTVSNFFKDTIDRLGVQAQEADRMVKNQEQLLSSINETRDSISGVSLDEEMANLIQFQHAYSANAKIISTVDELLDVVINGLKK